MRDKPNWKKFSKRVSEYALFKIGESLNEAYYALETDPEALKEANRPLVNDPKMAQELVYSAIEVLENLEDLPVTEIDRQVTNLEHYINKIKTLEIRASVQHGD